MRKLLNTAGGMLLSTLLLASSPTRAQDAPIMALDPTLMAGWTGNIGNASAAASKAGSKVKTNFSYTSTTALRQRVVNKFVERLRSQTSQGAQAISSTFGAGKADYDAYYQQMLKTSALQNNNAADALAGLMLAGYQIVNNVPEEQVTKTMERGARTQVTGILNKSSKMTSAAARAQMGEELKLQTVILALGLQESLNNKTDAAYRQSIASMFQQQYGINLKQIKLTNQGFAKK